ncbi:ASKHA domain-containing protein [bacterium]|nr:ASKHA domain-containing protein [bacterium]
MMKKKRQIKINGGRYSFYSGETFRDILLRNDLGMIFPCGGGGICGKCRVKIISGKQKITIQDKEKIDKAELKQGWRLACKMVPQSGVEVYIPHENTIGSRKVRFTESRPDGKTVEFAVIDAGSSTVKAMLADGAGNAGPVFSVANPQIKISTDIIGRIGFAMESANNYTFLRNLLIEGINNVLKEALISSGKVSSGIRRGLIAGNSFITALLKEESLKGLSAVPFNCANRKSKKIKSGDFFRLGSVSVLPVIGGFVGADALAGCLYLRKYYKNKNVILIDIGTNAEIIVYYGGKYFAASASAGPAFEGLGMSCGFPMLEGAVRDIRFKPADNKALSRESRFNFTVSSMGHLKPVGICGTGYLSAVAEFLKKGLIDRTGRIAGEKDRIEITDDISINQKDIRMFQDAKAAIAAGISLILKKIKAGYGDFAEILVSGAFGSNVSVDDFYATGIISPEFRKVKAMDNLVLKSMLDVVAGGVSMSKLESFAAKVKRIKLAEDKDFMEYYTGAMSFEK